MTTRRLLPCAIQRWDHFWFEKVPSDLFALVRITVGAAGLVSLLGVLPVEVFWLPDGIIPLANAGAGLRNFIIGSGLGGIAGSALFLTLFVSFVCMTTGFLTGAAVAVCLFGSILQAQWNPLPLTSGHALLEAVLFCLLWADCGARFSVDAWRRRHRRPLPDSAVRHVATISQPIWPLRLIRTQIALLYLTSGLFKLLSPTWRDGSAIYFSSSQNIYGRIFQAYALPTSFDWLLTLLTYVALFWEIAFALMLLNHRTRKVALLLGVAIHLGIWATMEVGPFSYMILATYPAFLDPTTTSQFLARRFRRSTAIAVKNSADCSVETVTSSTPAA